jgi:hypothetical protein
MVKLEEPHGQIKLSVLLRLGGGGGAAVIGFNYYGRTHHMEEDMSCFLIIFIPKLPK